MNLVGKFLSLLGVRRSLDETITTSLAKKVIGALGVSPYSATYFRFKGIYSVLGGGKKDFVSNSIFGEDSILRRYLPESEGRYCDIGSGVPVQGSNTYFLYKQGWSGVTVDPVRGNIRKHKHKRPRDEQISAAVSGGSSGHPIIFYEFSAHEFSTTSAERVAELAEKGIGPKKVYEIPVIGTSEIVEKVTPLDPYFLDIDVEGNEFEILRGLRWDESRPRVIAVEEWSSPIYRGSEIRTLLESRGYLLVSRAFITSIYVHADYLALQRSKSESWTGWFDE